MKSQSTVYDSLQVRIFPTRDKMGRAAAEHVCALLQELLARQAFVNVMFAAAPSQNEFLDHLSKMKGIEWSRVNAFHMDEYFSLPADAEQLFSKYLTDRLFSKVALNAVHVFNAVAADPVEECARYAELLKTHPIDIVCMGIGENGHIAFNDPPVADFNDLLLAKVVELDQPCRQQQVNDGSFASIADVPTYAITVTVPQLMSARYVSIVVPTERKAVAVRNTLLGPVSTKVPASILRRHKQAALFLDEASASLLSS